MPAYHPLRVDVTPEHGADHRPRDRKDACSTSSRTSAVSAASCASRCRERASRTSSSSSPRRDAAGGAHERARAPSCTAKGKIRATNLTFIFWDLFYPLGYLLVFGVGMTQAMGMKPRGHRRRLQRVLSRRRARHGQLRHRVEYGVVVLHGPRQRHLLRDADLSHEALRVPARQGPVQSADFDRPGRRDGHAGGRRARRADPVGLAAAARRPRSSSAPRAGSSSTRSSRSSFAATTSSTR